MKPDVKKEYEERINEMNTIALTMAIAYSLILIVLIVYG